MYVSIKVYLFRRAIFISEISHHCFSSSKSWFCSNIRLICSFERGFDGLPTGFLLGGGAGVLENAESRKSRKRLLKTKNFYTLKIGNLSVLANCRMNLHIYTYFHLKLNFNIKGMLLTSQINNTIVDFSITFS